MKRTPFSYFVFAVALVIAVAGLLMWVVRSREIKERQQQGQVDNPDPGKGPGTKPNGGQGGQSGNNGGNNSISSDPGVPEDPDPLRQDPDALMKAMTQALNDVDMEQFNRLSGNKIDAASLKALGELAAQQKALGRMFEMREVGELAINQGRRWAIEAGQNGDSRRIYLDLVKGPDGWTVERVTLPGSDPNAPAANDALAAAEVFLLAVLSQDFEVARMHVDGLKVSDARIAGLCILFEEGKYQLRKQKPLRAMLQRDAFASYLATVVATDGSEAAQFGLNLERGGDPARWKVTEINLDKLLADYAQRVAGGDVYYSPFVRNPEGGDTLALYFGFDEDEINPRTRRQLEIVAAILKADQAKKLTLSGHTDSKGTDDYNKQLSLRRAEVVKQFLLDAGVKTTQVVTLGKGSTQPRRPNVTETGADDPDGRRANRRTEIYLDF